MRDARYPAYMQNPGENAADRAQLEIAVLAICFAAALAAGGGICYGDAPILLAGLGVALIWGACSFALQFADWYSAPPAAALTSHQPKDYLASRLAKNARIVFAASLIVPLSRAFV